MSKVKHVKIKRRKVSTSSFAMGLFIFGCLFFCFINLLFKSMELNKALITLFFGFMATALAHAIIVDWNKGAFHYTEVEEAELVNE